MPADDREPGAHFPKRGQTTTQTNEDGSHYYRIRGTLCFRSNPDCDEDWAKIVFDHVNRNDIPFTDDDEREGDHEIGPTVAPITHDQNDRELWSTNITRRRHPFHPGTVTHRVHFEDRALIYDAIGDGQGEYPRINNFIGIAVFRPRLEEVVRKFKDPPRVRSWVMDIDIYP